ARSRQPSTGDAGNVTVEGSNITLTGGAFISSSTFGPGHGGEVTVRASEALTITGRDAAGTPGGLFSNTLGSGTGGQVLVETRRLTIQAGAAISSDTFSRGLAGTVNVRAGTLVLDGAGTFISSISGEGSTGDASNVVVEGTAVALSGGAQISS